MYTSSKEVREFLTNTGFCKKAVILENNECVLAYCGDTDKILVAIYRDNEWFYAKSVAEDLVNPHQWHCRDLKYIPYGLYSFAKKLDDLVEVMKSKIELIHAQLVVGYRKLSEIEEG